MAVAAAVNVALLPTLTEVLVGWEVMLGAHVTVSVAALVAVVTVELVNRALYFTPLSEVTVTGVV